MRRVSLLVMMVLALSATWGKTLVTIVSPDWVADHLGDANLRLLDVRQDMQGYFGAHLPNAVFFPDGIIRAPREGLPLQFLSPAELAEQFSRAGVRDGGLVVAYSDGENVLGATMIAYALEKIGYPVVAVMDGGWSAYAAARLPSTRQYPAYKEEKVVPREDPDIAITLAELTPLLGKPGVILLDARTPAMYAGTVNLWQRNGHIPGARNIDWHTLMDPQNPHKFKNPRDLQAIFDAQGITREHTIIVYCNTGREASAEYYALRLLGYPHVRLYEGSWAEYSAHPELPMTVGMEP